MQNVTARNKVQQNIILIILVRDFYANLRIYLRKLVLWECYVLFHTMCPLSNFSVCSDFL